MFPSRVSFFQIAVFFPFLMHVVTGFHIIKDESKTIDVSMARTMQEENGIQTPAYIPVTDVMDAIHSDQKVVVINVTDDGINLNAGTYEQLVGQNRHNSTMTFNFPDYSDLYSLNNVDALKSIVNVSSTSLAICYSSFVNTSAIDTDDVFVLSEDGLKELRSSIVGSAFGNYATASNMTRNSGFAFLRKVLNVTYVELSIEQMKSFKGPCINIITMDILPLEIFDSFEFKSNASNAFHENYFPISQTNATARKLQGNQGCVQNTITFDDVWWLPTGACAQ